MTYDEEKTILCEWITLVRFDLNLSVSCEFDIYLETFNYEITDVSTIKKSNDTLREKHDLQEYRWQEIASVLAVENER